MDPLTAILLLIAVPFILFAPGLAWSFVLAPARPADPNERLDPWLRAVLALAASLTLETVLLLGIYVLDLPINAWSVAAVLALLTGPPMVLLYLRRPREAPEEASSQAPEPAPQQGPSQ